MKIIVAPNSFKNSLPADEVAKALREGILQSGFNGVVECLPVGDGGDGTGKLLRQYLGAKFIPLKVKDPLGRPVDAGFGVTKGGVAIIELADASGLRLLEPEEYHPLVANTSGTGTLIKAALDHHVSKIILCVGGSATVDGGAGILKELGVVFKNIIGAEIKDFPLGLIDLKGIDISNIDKRILEAEIVVLCDVKNKLLGDGGAAKVFGPQKGANEYDIRFLEACLQKLNTATYKTTGRHIGNVVHGGAAGGVAAALWALYEAQLAGGIDYFLRLINFEKNIADACLVITGEGAIDKQTLNGKAPYGVAVAAKKLKLPVMVVAGKIEDEKKLSKYFDEIICINPRGISEEQALKNAYQNLVKTGKRICNNLH